jgi:FAD/FMN-containing dehydrogenase/Fe-S oxidoreductase
MSALVPVERLRRKPESRAKKNGVDVARLYARLAEHVEGEVRFDAGTRGLYAQDASNYYHAPLGVVLPRHDADVLAALAAAREFGAAIVSRTGGTSLAGQSCGDALVLDFSKYMRRIVEIDASERRARVEPGVICEELSDAAKKFSLTWGPQPATHSRCGFGGMISNNCGGMHAQYAGIAVHNVEALDVALYDGTRMHLGWMNEDELAREIAKGDRASEVLSALRALRDRHATRIRDGYPRIPRRVSGYNLDELLPKEDGRFNLARSLVGTEGTCVTYLEAEIRLVDLRPERVIVIVGYATVFDAADAVMDVVAADVDPMAIEGMDERLRSRLRESGQPGHEYLKTLPEGHGWLFVQIGSSAIEDARMRAKKLVDAVRATGKVKGVRVVEDEETEKGIWRMREGGLGATAFPRGKRDAWEGWEDSAVAPGKLGDYLRELDALYAKYDYESVLYGHFGQGLVHCRVDFDLQSHDGIAKFHRFLEEATELCAVRFGGSLSGEHGDGESKAEFLTKMFGHELVTAFHEFKAIWDPRGKMNPGKIVDPYPADTHLRLGASYDPAQPETHFRFPRDGGSFAHATLRCVGVGKCRNTKTHEHDVMCPSFLVTEEERHSTRGRAHLLWEMLRGEGPVKPDFANEAVKESLDLCLACKGCKSDCPVGVDIASYKAEFLSHYYEHRARPRHAHAFGKIDRWAALASIAPGLANLTTQTPGLRALAKLACGVHPSRAIPAFAPETFRAWFTRRPPHAPSARGEKVLLWVDTFNDNFHPDVARAAVRVLEHFGFSVEIPRVRVCCGRPLYDFGMLDAAKAYLEKTLEVLALHVDAGTPMIVLEPSCCSVFRDELGELMPGRNEARNLARQTFLLSEFLAARVAPEDIPKLHRKAIVQTHCHHHAIMGFDAEKKILDAMELDVEVLRSGCCGMAGSFGFERDKRDVSQAAGERVLLPRVRDAEPSTLVLADGFSCKEQIAQSTPRHGVHLARALEMAIDHGANGPDDAPFVESSIERAAAVAVRRSMRRAAVSVALALVVLGCAIVTLILLTAARP